MPFDEDRSNVGSLKRQMSYEDSARNDIELSSPAKKKHGDISTLSKSQIDGFCWICHKENQAPQSRLCCHGCIRSFHLKCLKMMSTPTDWICPECVKILTAESMSGHTTKKSHVKQEQLSIMLKYVVVRMSRYNNIEPFLQPVDVNEELNYADYVVNPMDLGTLERNVRKKMYSSVEGFLADCFWIYHNCVVYNGLYHKLTSIAKTIVRAAKTEVTDMELCPDCFYYGCLRRNDYFTLPCTQPHELLWAKLKGFPHWPGKVIQEKNGLLEVRFFGQHDRAWCSTKDCFMISEEIPFNVKKSAISFQKALKEVEHYIVAYKRRFGQFRLYPPRTPFEWPSRKHAGSRVDACGVIEPADQPSFATVDDFATIDVDVEDEESLSGSSFGRNRPAPLSVKRRRRALVSGSYSRNSADGNCPGNTTAQLVQKDLERLASKSSSDKRFITEHVNELLGLAGDKLICPPASPERVGGEVANAGQHGTDDESKECRKNDDITVTEIENRVKQMVSSEYKTDLGKDIMSSISDDKIDDVIIICDDIISSESKKTSNSRKTRKCLNDVIQTISQHKNTVNPPPANIPDGAITSRTPVSCPTISTFDGCPASNAQLRENDRVPEVETVIAGGFPRMRSQLSSPSSSDDYPRNYNSVIRTTESMPVPVSVETLASLSKEAAKEPAQSAVSMATSVPKCQTSSNGSTGQTLANVLKKPPVIHNRLSAAGAVVPPGRVVPPQNSPGAARGTAGAANQTTVPRGMTISTKVTSFPNRLANSPTIPQTAGSVAGVPNVSQSSRGIVAFPRGPSVSKGAVSSVINNIYSATGAPINSPFAGKPTALIQRMLSPNYENSMLQMPGQSIPFTNGNRGHIQVADTTTQQLASISGKHPACQEVTSNSMSQNGLPMPHLFWNGSSRMPNFATNTSKFMPILPRPGPATVMTPTVRTTASLGGALTASNGEPSPIMTALPGNPGVPLVVSMPRTECESEPHLSRSLPLDQPIQVNKYEKKMLEALKDVVGDIHLDLSMQLIQKNDHEKLRPNLEFEQFKHQKEVADIKMKTEHNLMGIRKALEEKYQISLLHLRSEHAKERDRWIKEKEQMAKDIKRKQWCASCLKEAVYHCCWNTSYCDYPCQQAHWPEHMATCSQIDHNQQSMAELPKKLHQSVSFYVPPSYKKTSPYAQTASHNPTNLSKLVSREYTGPPNVVFDGRQTSMLNASNRYRAPMKLSPSDLRSCRPYR